MNWNQICELYFFTSLTCRTKYVLRRLVPLNNRLKQARAKAGTLKQEKGFARIHLRRTVETLSYDDTKSQTKVVLKEEWSSVKGTSTCKYQNKGLKKVVLKRGVIISQGYIYMQVSRQRF